MKSQAEVQGREVDEKCQDRAQIQLKTREQKEGRDVVIGSGLPIARAGYQHYSQSRSHREEQAETANSYGSQILTAQMDQKQRQEQEKLGQVVDVQRPRAGDEGNDFHQEDQTSEGAGYFKDKDF